MGYDLAGRRVLLTDANGNRTTFLFDATGQQTRQVDGLGRATTFAYDLAGRRNLVLDARLASEQHLRRRWTTHHRAVAGHARNTFSYDGAGRRILLIDALGRTSTTYDAKGRTLAVAQPTNSASVTFTMRRIADATSSTQTADAPPRRTTAPDN